MSDITTEVKEATGATTGESTPTPQAEPAIETTPGSEKTAPTVPSSPLPFHQDPKVQEYLNRQMTRREKEWNQKMQAMQEDYTSRMEKLAASRQGQPEQVFSPEQDTALAQLADLMAKHPKFRDVFGMEKSAKLERELSEYREANERKAFEGELSGVVKQYADSHGYDPKDLDTDLREFIDTEYPEVGYKDGIVKKLAKLYFADKTDDLAQRAANMKLIKEQQAKKNGNVETPAGGAKKDDKNLPASMHQHLQNIVSGVTSFGR